MVLPTSLEAFVGYFIVELFGLVFLRQWLAQRITSLSVCLFHDSRIGIWIYSVLTLPGILLHEIAHFLTAALLGLRTGSIEMLPQLSKDGAVELGSVQVAVSDPFRQTIVGAAPFLFGLPMVIWLSSLLPPPTWPYHLSWPVGLWLYLIVSISLHFFPSRRDMTAWPIVGTFLGIALLSVSMIGVTIPAFTHLASTVYFWLVRSVFSLGIAITVTFCWALLLGVARQLSHVFSGVQ